LIAYGRPRSSTTSAAIPAEVRQTPRASAA
jgi:hypothetical protein